MALSGNKALVLVEQHYSMLHIPSARICHLSWQFKFSLQLIFFLNSFWFLCKIFWSSGCFSNNSVHHSYLSSAFITSFAWPLKKKVKKKTNSYFINKIYVVLYRHNYKCRLYWYLLHHLENPWRYALKIEYIWRNEWEQLKPFKVCRLLHIHKKQHNIYR